MSAESHYPSPQEIRAYMRRAHQERSRLFFEMIAWLFAALRAARASSHEKLSTSVAARSGSHSHRLAA